MRSNGLFGGVRKKASFLLPALAGVMRNEGSGFVKLLRAISDEVISEAGSAEQQVMENVQSSSMGRSA